MRLYGIAVMKNVDSTDCPIMGVFSTLENAKHVVENNVTDIYETCYNYAVIESIVVDSIYNLHPEGRREEYWYKWEGDYETGKYVSCDKPEELKQLVGWVI